MSGVYGDFDKNRCWRCDRCFRVRARDWNVAPGGKMKLDASYFAPWAGLFPHPDFISSPSSDPPTTSPSEEKVFDQELLLMFPLASEQKQ